MTFKRESDLLATALASAYFRRLLTSYGDTKCLLEPRGLFGIPDVVIVNLDPNNCVEAFAFEMKLCNWKRALTQAYRYRSFAEMSYVVLSRKHVLPALLHLDDFRRANVGLLSLDETGDLYIHYQPTPEDPFCRWTRSNLERMLVAERIRTLGEASTSESTALGFPTPRDARGAQRILVQ